MPLRFESVDALCFVRGSEKHTNCEQGQREQSTHERRTLALLWAQLCTTSFEVSA